MAERRVFVFDDNFEAFTREIEDLFDAADDLLHKIEEVCSNMREMTDE